jgi:DNA (cytosine-5)-methyltransferase 1
VKIGALFYGAGGLDIAVRNTFGGDLEWYAEFDANVARIPAWNHPGVPNLGDVTKIDWAKVPPVDIITGGSPCQDLSHCGARAGMFEGTRSNLWVEMREAIAVIRPRLVVWENVRGAYLVEADSAVERCPRCVGEDRRTPPLRALGRVLGDLASIGYDARWHGLTASEVGAPHDRFRVFLLAYPFGAAPPDTLDPRPLDYGRGPVGGAIAHLAVRPSSTEETLHWGRYQRAILRWRRLIGWEPSPVRRNPELDRDQVTPEFIEWMMGMPKGWVTEVPGVKRKPAIRALGNSVVPLQAEAAFRVMCDWSAYS